MKRVAYATALREALTEELDRDATVFLLCGDVDGFDGFFSVTRGMVQKYGPERIRNMPVSVNSLADVGLGAALKGMRPVVEMTFMDAITLAMDRIVHHVATCHAVYGGQVGAPLVIRIPTGGGCGDGVTRLQSRQAWLLSVPGIKVVAPAFPNDAKGLLKTAIRDDNPVVMIESKALYGYVDDVDAGEVLAPIGNARVVREGEDVTVVAYSRMLHEALVAADELIQQGICVEVVDLRSLYPLDMATVVQSVRKTGRVLVAEEGVQCWGVGAEIACRITEECFDDLLAPVVRVGAPDMPVPCTLDPEAMVLPDAARIGQQLLSMVAERRKTVGVSRALEAM